MSPQGPARPIESSRPAVFVRVAALIAAALIGEPGLAVSTAKALAPHGGPEAPQDNLTASIRGRVQVPWKGDAISLVAAIPHDARTAPIEPAPVLDQMELTFVPRLLPVTLGTVVRFRNSDPLLHNVFSASDQVSAFDLGTYAQGEDRTVRFDRPGVAVVLCNVHPQMAAFVLVVETSFWALTEDGEYLIEGLPAGPTMLRFWTETGEPVEQWVDLEAGAETRVDFTFPQRRRGGWLDSVW